MGVERNMNQRELNVPRCVARSMCAIRVAVTL